MTKLVPVEVHETTRVEDEDPAAPAVGKWYQISFQEHQRDADGDPLWDAPKVTVQYLGCITHMGSNYAEVTQVGGASSRVHLDEFAARCEFVPNAGAIIEARVREKQAAVNRLMDQVKELTMRLGVSPMQQLASGAETQALSTRNASDGDVKGYETALVQAKDKQLPELFKKIKEKTESLQRWMSASLIPLEAEADQLKGSIEIIKQRIFHVKLYAGLVEEIVQITDGEPAAPTEPLHLFQRRCYMDEECLARYEAGGMCYQNVGEFHTWLARPENRSRILPFPRCVVAFRIRRDAKWREMVTVSDFFRIIEEEKADQKTFLYLRNGEQIYCLSTGIEFGAQLFPDVDRRDLDGALMARMFGDSVQEILPKWRWQARVKLATEARKKQREAYEAAPKKERWHLDRDPWEYRDIYEKAWQPYEPNNIHYDDIQKHVKAQVDEHNRLVLVLQGILDRSPVFHPHPPWQLWKPEGFARALKLIYDDTKGLTPGEKPDFEEYRRRLNASIKVGTVTVGQEVAWEKREAKKKNKKHEGDSHYRERYRYRPHDDPGPGLLAKVDKIRGGKPMYAWERHTYKSKRVWVDSKTRKGWGRYERNFDQMIPCKLFVARDEIFNVDAYTPGDYRLFFDDPRTRAEYLQWAPLLLVAEDYHAGVRTLENRGERPKPGRRWRYNDNGSKYETEMDSEEVAAGTRYYTDDAGHHVESAADDDPVAVADSRDDDDDDDTGSAVDPDETEGDDEDDEDAAVAQHDEEE